MNEHFIKKINISKFKCFDNFKAEGFNRVNLIGGKNNVGKTAFMEACYINIHADELSSFCTSMVDIKYMRENLNILHDSSMYNEVNFIEQYDGINIKTDQNDIKFNIVENAGMKKNIFQYNNQKIDVNINDFSFSFMYIDKVNFIDNFGLCNGDIIKNYSSIQKEDKEQYLNNILKEFDSQIEAFKIIDEKPQCKVDGIYREITEFGDGVRHLISIVVSIFQSKDGYLFIDEIDNGIHYTQLDRLWEVVLNVSREQSVQVFATTHSKECIEAYSRAFEKAEDKDVSFISLYKNKENKLKNIVLDYDMISQRIELGLDNR